MPQSLYSLAHPHVFPFSSPAASLPTQNSKFTLSTAQTANRTPQPPSTSRASTTRLSRPCPPQFKMRSATFSQSKSSPIPTFAPESERSKLTSFSRPRYAMAAFVLVCACVSTLSPGRGAHNCSFVFKIAAEAVSQPRCAVVFPPAAADVGSPSECRLNLHQV